MADRAIVKIEVSDSDDRFRMKVNQNFQQLSRGLIVDGPLRQTINESVITDMDQILNYVFAVLCPVGTIIFTSTTSDPRLSRGTWKRIENKFLLASSSSHPLNSTGGSETVSLTASNNGSHTHTASSSRHTHSIDVNTGGSHTHSGSTSENGGHVHLMSHWYDVTVDPNPSTAVGRADWYNGSNPKSCMTSWVDGHTHSVTISSGGSHYHDASASYAGGSVDIGSSGSGAAHENMPPYISKYCFERIA